MNWFTRRICSSGLPYRADWSVIMWEAFLFWDGGAGWREGKWHTITSTLFNIWCYAKALHWGPWHILTQGGFSFWKLPGKLGPVQKVLGVPSIYKGMIYCLSAPSLSEGWRRNGKHWHKSWGIFPIANCGSLTLARSHTVSPPSFPWESTQNVL